MNSQQLKDKIRNISKERWKSYQRKYDYANNIDFDVILMCLQKIISNINPLS